MNALETHQLAEALEALKLDTVAEALPATAQRAAAENWAYPRFLAELLAAERAERLRKRVALNLKFARFPHVKRLCDFDCAHTGGLVGKVQPDPFGKEVWLDAQFAGHLRRRSATSDHIRDRVGFEFAGLLTPPVARLWFVGAHSLFSLRISTERVYFFGGGSRCSWR